jgi:hypothetical protein
MFQYLSLIKIFILAITYNIFYRYNIPAITQTYIGIIRIGILYLYLYSGSAIQVPVALSSSSLFNRKAETNNRLMNL